MVETKTEYKFTVLHIQKGMKAARREVGDTELLVKVLNTFIELLEDLNGRGPKDPSGNE